MDNSEAYRLECECRAWKRLIAQNGRNWWIKTKRQIVKKRGEDGLKYLLGAMNAKNERAK